MAGGWGGVQPWFVASSRAGWRGGVVEECIAFAAESEGANNGR